METKILKSHEDPKNLVKIQKWIEKHDNYIQPDKIAAYALKVFRDMSEVYTGVFTAKQIKDFINTNYPL